MLFADPASAHMLMDKLADSVASYLNAQIDAGATFSTNALDD